jgi:Zn-dependent protease with chaperone function
MSWKRTILAFLVGPVITPLNFLTVNLVSQILSPTYPWGLALDPWFYIFVGVYAYLAAAIFGLPFYFLFRALRGTNIVLFALGGGIIGFSVSIILLDNQRFFESTADRVGFTLSGTLSALVFGLIAFKRRRDGDARSQVMGQP